MEELHELLVQTSDHAPRSGPGIKNGSGAEDGTPERLRCGTVKEEVNQILQMVSQALHEEFFLSCIGKRIKEGCDHGSEVETIHSG